MPRKTITSFILAASCGLTMLTQINAAETRFHQYTKQFERPSQPAEVISSGYLGGSGDEYLSSVAITPKARCLWAVLPSVPNYR